MNIGLVPLQSGLSNALISFFFSPSSLPNHHFIFLTPPQHLFAAVFRAVQEPAGGLLGASDGIGPPVVLRPKKRNPRTAVFSPDSECYRMRQNFSLVGVRLQTVLRDGQGTLECGGRLKIEMLETGVMIRLKDFTE